MTILIARRKIPLNLIRMMSESINSSLFRLKGQEFGMSRALIPKTSPNKLINRKMMKKNINSPLGVLEVISIVLDPALERYVNGHI